ncbi:MAG: phosphate acyltransferase PlsX [Kiritimatiellae bacterium]|nr:phosphate acyltransferase PlsX [Kiritimatiellia bacterium]
MKIALDVMGGDHAPEEIVKGAVEAVAKLKGLDTIYLVGDEQATKAELAKYRQADMTKLEIVHAPESIGMDESPADAVRKKKNCSINVAMGLVKRGAADAFVSAGNSGAVSASALFTLSRIKGVLRPAIATVLPSRLSDHPVLVLDAGANTDCHEDWLVQFAVMGSAYSRCILKRPNPLVGLLSIGTEDCKGNEMTKKAFPLLQVAPGLNFHGNIEGHDIFQGEIDVVVCDGFVGNVVLKTTESVAHAVGDWMKNEFTRTTLRKMATLLLKFCGAFKSLKKKMDPEMYGGAPLLGVNGPVIITHGASTSRAIYHAVRIGIHAAKTDLTGEIAARIADLNNSKAAE